jgi:HSP20 family protein
MPLRDDWVRRTIRLRLADDDPVQPRRWRPAADVHRTRTGWLIKIELAGVPEEDIEVIVHGRLLVVRGLRHDRECRDTGEFWSMEIRYSEFERVFEMPCELGADLVRTEKRDGMLLVTIEPCEGET